MYTSTIICQKAKFKPFFASKTILSVPIHLDETDSVCLHRIFTCSVGRPESRPPPLSSIGEMLGNAKIGDDFMHIGLVATRSIRSYIHRSISDESFIRDIVWLSKDGMVSPANLPDAANMAILPKDLKQMVKWVLNEHINDKHDELVYSSVQAFIDLVPIIPHVREYCLLKQGKNTISYNSYTDSFKRFTIGVGMELVTVATKTINLSYAPDEGRKITIEFVLGYRHTSPPYHVVVWNCRGMVRPSFLPNILHIREWHSPDTIILTETRVSRYIAMQIARQLLNNLHLVW